MLTFTECPKKPGIKLFPKENKLFVGDFRVTLDETYADMVQFTQRWNWKWTI